MLPNENLILDPATLSIVKLNTVYYYSKMTKTPKKDLTKRMTPKRLQNKILKRLEPIERMSFMERCGIFMGKVQIVEAALKGLLNRGYGYEQERMERWTLGRVIAELKGQGLRGDFVLVLEELLVYRNTIAHDLVAYDAITRKILGPKSKGFSWPWRFLSKGLYQVEYTIQVYDFLSTNDYF